MIETGWSFGCERKKYKIFILLSPLSSAIDDFIAENYWPVTWDDNSGLFQSLKRHSMNLNRIRDRNMLTIYLETYFIYTGEAW